MLVVCRITSYASQLNAQCPVQFFTTVASRLLSSELNVDLDDIEIYPTNQYTPAVHRLLQVTANIYDATTTNYYPTIFSPTFKVVVTNGCTNVFIAGYEQQTNLIDESTEFVNPELASSVDVESLLDFPTNTVIEANVYDVPWVIGAKKGLPNFNEFSSESVFQISRKLEFVRDWSNPNQPDIVATNQMYLMNFTNYLGVEFWNSYRSSYTGPVDIMVRLTSMMALTNDDNMPIYYAAMTNWFFIETNSWTNWNGIVGLSQTPSPFITWSTNLNFFSSTVAYAYSLPGFYSVGLTNYLDNGIRALPHFGWLTTNYLQAVIIDYSAGFANGRIIDYVQLGNLNSSRDLNAEIQANDVDGMFDTNYDAYGNLEGVFQQIYLSEYGTLVGGGSPVGNGSWTTAQIPGGPAGNTSPTAQQAFFRAFVVSPNGIYYYNGVPYAIPQTIFQVQAPYTPLVYGIQYLTWQANDPLVHYLTSDLTALAVGAGLKQTVGWPENIGSVNNRYAPWGNVGTLGLSPEMDSNPYNSAYKDPLVRSSDDWNFPTNQSLNAEWLGQIHRGTPWQTLYLKSTNILDWSHLTQNGFTTWLYWIGDGNLADATNMSPVCDWQLVGLLAEMFNTNNLSSLFPVNNPDPNAWRGLLDGMAALTNDVSNTQIRFLPAHFTPVTIMSNSTQAQIIADAIESARAAKPNQLFTNVSEIFGITSAIEQSPFLNLSATSQLTNGISDAAYEMIPSQLLPLLRSDSIGSMNGQFIVRFSGYDGHTYLIQASSDLINWTTISTNSPIGGTFSFTNMSGSDAKFYRSVLQN